METKENRQVRLAARPVGLPKETDWESTVEPIPSPEAGEIVVEVIYLSLDPAMRAWLNDVRSYVPPVGIGEVMRAIGIGRVVASAAPEFAIGDYVTGPFGIQQFARIKASEVQKIDPNLAPLTTQLSVLGVPGMTAYFGLLDVGKPEPGNTVVVSGAAGAVGAAVGQIAKIKGCRVVGIAGGPDKCTYLVEGLGFDAAIDYKSEDVTKRLRAECPKGIDIYFDNVGGDILDAALANLARKARVVICGAISQYNNTAPVRGPKNYMSLVVHRARMEGFLVFDYADRYAQAAKEMLGWIKAGKLVSREHVVQGIETFPSTLLKLFSGEHAGKLVLQVGEER
jgi:NADPH-dependent curcumin reductase CurA